MHTKEDGIALIMVLILGLVCFVLITGLFYILRESSFISGAIKRYSAALEVAKGGCNLILSGIDSGITTFTCNGNNTCIPCGSNLNENCQLDLPVSSLGNYTLKAYLLYSGVSIDGPSLSRIYTIRVVASKGQEKAIIDFVYKK